MPPEVLIKKKLSELCGRIRLLNALHWSSTLAFYASLVGVVLLIISKFHWVEVEIEAIIAVLAGVAVLGGVIGYLKHLSLMETARKTETRLHLKERLSSALEFLSLDAQHPLTTLQIADAAATSQQIDAKKTYPLRCPREAKLLGVSMGIILLLVFVPEMTLFQSPKVRAEHAAMKKQGEQIIRVAKQIQRHNSKNKSEISRQIAQNMERLGQDMKRNRLTKKQAMLQMHQLTRQMAQAQQRLRTEEAQKQLSEMMQQMKKASDSVPSSQQTESYKLLKQMTRAAVQKDLKKAQELAKKLSDRIKSGTMSEQEKKQLAEQLKKIAQGLKGAPKSQAASQMKKAAEAAQQGDLSKASTELAKAMESANANNSESQELENLQKMADAMQSTQQEMQKGEYG